MKIVKGYTKQINCGRSEFITETEYNNLIKEYNEKGYHKFIRSESEDFCTIGFSVDRNVIYLGWAYYPDFNQ